MDVEHQEVVMNADSTILVGVSGSPASLAALRWAKGEAERRGSLLNVVLIWQRGQRANYAQQAAWSDGTQRAEQALCAVADAARAELASGPRHNVTVEPVEGRIEQRLVAASKDADLLVLGSGPAGVIGPVVRTCLIEAHCPVVVVSCRVRPTTGPQGDDRLASEAARRREYVRLTGRHAGG